MWRQRCCQYSVRSYVKAGEPDQGETNWTADYWRGSTGSFTASSAGGSVPSPNGGDVLRVTVDDVGDVYVAGPRATSTGGDHWNIVKYDGANGRELWKVDRDLNGDTGNAWSIVFNPLDGLVYVHGDKQTASGLAYSLAIDPADGSYVPGHSPVSLLAYTNGLIYVPGTAVYTTPLVPLDLSSTLGPPSLPYYHAAAGGRMATLGAYPPTGSGYGAQLALTDFPFDGNNATLDPFQLWSTELWSALPHGAPLAVDLIDGGTDQLLAIAINPIYFASADTGSLALLDTAIDHGTVWNGTSFSGAGTPVTYRWRDTSLLKPRSQLKFQDASYLIVGANTSPTIEAVQTSDGSRAWAHYHLQPSGVTIGDDAIITVGTRKSKLTDVDFV